MRSRWLGSVLGTIAGVLMAQGVGCASLTTDEVAGVYDLDSVVVHYGESWEIEKHATDDEIAVVVGKYLHELYGSQLHLRPDGLCLVTPAYEDGASRRWTIEGDRVVGYSASMGFSEMVETRYEAEWNDGVLRILANDPDLPIDYVFVKRKEVLDD